MSKIELVDVIPIEKEIINYGKYISRITAKTFEINKENSDGN